MSTTTFDSTANHLAAWSGGRNVAGNASERGWADVMSQLVVERGDALTRYAYLISGNRDDASDLVQEALVRTFGRLRNGFTVASAEAYVRRAILNIHIDGSRRRNHWRRVAHLQFTPDADESRDVDTGARLDLQQQLGRLRPRERACLVLRYYEDLTVDAIAAELQISSGAVKRYLSDALASMAVTLNRDSERALRDGSGETKHAH